MNFPRKNLKIGLIYLAIGTPLAGCGGSDSNVTVSFNSPDAVAFSNIIGVTTDSNINIQVNVAAKPDFTLSSYGISSSQIPALNSPQIALSGTEYSTSYNFQPVKDAKTKISVGTLTANGTAKTNSQTYEFYRVTRYMNNDPRQVLSIHRPNNSQTMRPALLFVHGNGGDFTYFYKDSVEAAQNNIVALTMDFRSFDTPQSGNAEIPVQIEDVRCAIQYMKANYVELGIDPDNIGLVGYSIGSVVGLLAAFDQTGSIPNAPGYSSRCQYFGQNTSIKAVATHSSAADGLLLTATASEKGTPGATRNAYERFLGVSHGATAFIKTNYETFKKANPSATTEQWKTHLRTTSTAEPNKSIVETIERTSPVNHVGKLPIPLLVMHGDKDYSFPFEHQSMIVNSAVRSETYTYSFTSSVDAHNWNAFELQLRSESRACYKAFFDKYLRGKVMTPDEISKLPTQCTVR